MMMFSLILLFMAITTDSDAAPTVKFNNLSEVLPMDPKVTTGVLDNGLTYYIRENNKPRTIAGLYQSVAQLNFVSES